MAVFTRKKKTLRKKSSSSEIKNVRNLKAAPVNEGEEYDLEISNEKGGFGVAKVKNFSIYVVNASRGESVHVQILKVKKDHAVARIMSSEEPMSLGKNLKEQYENAERMAAAGVLQPPEEEED